MICSVLKRWFRRGGKLHTTRSYYLRYKFDWMPCDKWISLRVTDKQAAEKKAKEFIREKECEHMGIAPPRTSHDTVMSSLEAHMSDYLRDLKSRGRDGSNGKGAQKLSSRITTLIKECGWKRVGNVTPSSFVEWRNKSTLAARTRNHYLDAANGLLNWMERMGRITSNPLRRVEKVQTSGKEERIRRALTDSELNQLIKVSGPRGIVYFAAARCGLRQDELKEILWGDLQLDSVPSSIRLRPEVSKNDKDQTVPMLPELRDVLLKHRPTDFKASDPVFGKLVPRARMLRKDLERACIPYQDERGHYADFHALRKTFATFLAANGIDERTASIMLRHSDTRLTREVYTDQKQLPIYEAIKELPTLDSESECAHIYAQNSGKQGQNLSEGVGGILEELVAQSVNNALVRLGLAVPVAPRQMVEAGGVEPPS